MADHADRRCFHCQRVRPYEVMVPGEMLRPAIIETIKKRAPTWTTAEMICADCLDLFRSEYVEDALKDEVGELTKLEQEVIDSLREQETLTENVNRAFAKSGRSHVADRVALFGGGWIFIGSFFLPLATWIGIDSVATFFGPFDPYPYILLNLMLSCLAAMQAPIIMMSQNRIEARDRLRSENDYQVNLKAELEIRHLHEKLDVLLSTSGRNF